MRKKLIVSVTLMAFILSSVNLVNGKGFESLKDDDDSIETRVYLRKQCLLSADKIEDLDSAEPNKLVGALAGILIPIAIQSILGGISSALKKAGSKQTKSDSGKRPTYLYKINDQNPPSLGKIDGGQGLGAKTITFDGVTASKKFTKGDSFKIAGNGQRYVLMADVDADTNGAVSAAKIAPGLVVDVADDTVISFDSRLIGKLSLNSDLRCLILVRGKFDLEKSDERSKVWIDTDTNLSNGNGKVLNEESQETDREVRLQNSGIPILTGGVILVYEAKIKRSSDNTAMLYESRFLQVNSFQGTRSKRKPRNLVISLSVFGAGNMEGTPVLSFAMIDLGKVKAGTIKGPKQLRSKFTGWLGGLGISTKALESIENLEIGDELMPATFQATIVETHDGNKALRFIADVLEATKEDAAKALSAEFQKDRKAEAEEEENAAEKLRQEEEAAYSACLKAIKEWKETGPFPASGSEAENFLKYEIRRAVRVWTSKKSLLEKAGLGVSGDASVCKEK